MLVNTPHGVVFVNLPKNEVQDIEANQKKRNLMKLRIKGCKVMDVKNIEPIIYKRMAKQGDKAPEEVHLGGEHCTTWNREEYTKHNEIKFSEISVNYKEAKKY